MDIRKHIKAWTSVLVVAGLFIATSYVAKIYSEPLTRFVKEGPGIVALAAYWFVTFTATVFPPITSLPLLPVASQVWGPVLAALITATGWLTGSVVAFILARRYGQELVKRFISEDVLEKTHEYFPSREKGTFWFLAVLQVVLPVDVLCYGAGLFTDVPLKTYVGATALGMLPGAFFFAYAGTLPLVWQLAGLTLGGIVLVLGSWIVRKKHEGHSSLWRHAHGL
jgi:uncharacterized membrane protein YdjX (TVP38/TMEM64 family)